MDLVKLQNILKSYPAYRLKQVKQALFKETVGHWDEAKSLPADLREILNRECHLGIEAEIFKSKDGETVKAGLKMDDGAVVESVLMKHNDGRNTVCVSCQVGCAMNCVFCATGKLGLKRNLSAFEIVEQVLIFERMLRHEWSGEKVTNVVFMGMGEPFNNYENVMEAVRMLNDEVGIGARSISISTCGIVEGIRKFAREGLQVKLALSLHAPNDELRDRLMLVNKTYPLKDVLKEIAVYIRNTNKKVMIEYLLLDGVNDSDENARELAAVLLGSLGRLFMVNLILFNPTEGFKAPSKARILRFREILEMAGIEVTQRMRFGRDVKGACGQLGNAL